jgi:hypothetical protein
MIGREDEAHFMLPAGWWSTVGLVISLIGVLLLFRYGMPCRVRTGGSSMYVSSSSDPREAMLERRYAMVGFLGLFLVVLGTIRQIVGAMLGAT